MSFVRLYPFSEFDAVQNQMNRLLDELGTWQQDSTTWAPAIEFADSDGELVLKVALPGMTAEDIDIQLTKDSVRISGEYQRKNNHQTQGSYRSEFRYGKFGRTVNLPEAIDHERATADYADGILRLSLPKLIPASKQVIKLQVGDVPNHSLAENHADEPVES